MAFSGDLKTFPLPDLLSWLEGAHKPGRLTLGFGGGERVFYLGVGTVERFGVPDLYERLARLLRLMSLLDLRSAHQAVERARSGITAEHAFLSVGVPENALRDLARDDAFQAAADLFREDGGTFHFTEDIESGDDETIGVTLSLREVLYEAARRIDEASVAQKAIADDTATVRLAKMPQARLRGLKSAVLGATREASTVGALRLAIGWSRPGAALALHELMKDGYLVVEGADQPQTDPLTRLLRQGEQLLADGHFEAAALVFNSLLASDPSDPRVREFARAVEREHVDVLYRKLSPVAVPQLLPDASLSALRADERIVAALVNAKWDVSTLVLASPLRELQTLRALERMADLGLVELR